MEVLDKIKDFFIKDNIGEPPWEYDFLVNLDEGLYPLYLKKIFKYRTGEDLPIKKAGKDEWIIDKNKCKTFNQKIQWIKLHGVTPLMRDLTDKVKVRDYVKEKIGEEYLKPVLQIIPENKKTGCIDICPPCGESTFDNRNKGVQTDVSTYFDQIDFDKLPNTFVVKCNHGSKWQYIIKDKQDVLNTKPVVDIMRRNINGWLEQEYWVWNGFEMQYATCQREGCQEKGIEPKILIEPLLREEINIPPREIEVYCFKGKPKIFVNVRYGEKREITYYDENFNQIDLILHPDGNNVVKEEKADELIKQTFVLTKLLSKEFNFVRVDWLVFNNKLYFNELTLSPYSGFIEFDKDWNKKMGNWINIKGLNNEF